MKTTVTTFLTIIFCLGATAQVKVIEGIHQTEEDVNKTINKADFIFEAEVIENVFFQYDDGTAYPKLYTSSTLRITKIVKGSDKIQLGTITLITKGGMTREGLFLDKDWYGAGAKGLFFCKSSDLPTTGEITWAKDIESDYTQKVSDESITPIVDNPIVVTKTPTIEFGSDRKFKNRQELYDYLKEQKNEPVNNKTN
jgi:hypothetical protein